MSKSRTHTFTITVVFNKPCSSVVALREVKDCIHGGFYTTPKCDEDPDIFRVRSFKRDASANPTRRQAVRS